MIFGLIVALATTAIVVVTRDDGKNQPSVLQVPRDQLVRISSDAKLAAVDIPRAAAASSDVATLVHDNTAFGFDIYHELSARNGDNLFISPQSISTALALTYAGANSKTATEIAKALHFNLDPGRLHAAFNALDQQLLAPRGTQPGGTGQPLALEIDNSLWAQRGREFIKSFLDTLAADYGAPVHLVDYASDPQGAADAINAYVSANTKGRITKLLSPSDIDDLTRLVLANTVYFKGSWATPFQPGNPTPFHLLNGTTINPTMMTADDTRVSVAHTDTYDAVRIPYLGGASMRLIIPAAGHFNQVESELGVDLLERIHASETPQVVRLTMPKFAFSTKARLDDDLKALGMGNAFIPPTASGGADFTGLSPTRDLYIKTVIHQATIAVDENGTEATAATAVGMNATSAIVGTTALTVDRPFLVVVDDDATHALLFTGRVTNPSQH